MTNPVSEEIFDVVDEQDGVIGSRPRSEVHRLGLKHRAVHVLVFNARGEVFLQKRSMKKDCFPGAWDSSSSGHLDRGETYDACARRELREELGLIVPEVPARLFKLDACPRTGQEFCWVYRCFHEGPFVLQLEEIDEGRWVSPAEVTRWIAGRPGDFAPAFVLIWERWQTTCPTGVHSAPELDRPSGANAESAASPPADGSEPGRDGPGQSRR